MYFCAQKNEVALDISFDSFLEINGLPGEDLGSKDRKKKGRPREIELPLLYGERDTLVQLFASNWKKSPCNYNEFGE